MVGGSRLATLVGWQVWINRDILGSIPQDSLARHLGLAAALVVAAVAVAVALRRGFVPARVASLVLVALIVGELFVFSIPVRGDFGIIGRAVYGDDMRILERPQRYDPFTEPPYVSFLKQDSSVYRVFGMDYLLYPNTSSVYGLNDIRGFGALTVEGYFTYIKNFISPTVRQRFTGAYLAPFRSETEPAAYAANPLFDLLNVKYVISGSGLAELHDHSFIDAVLDANPSRPGIALNVFRINGAEEAVLFQHPPSTLSYELTPSADSRFLSFRLALSPAVWSPDRGDGVLFEISAVDGDSSETVFSRWVDPKNNPEDRRWVDGSVDLSPYLNRTVTLVLSTSQGASNLWDHAGWGGLRLTPSPDTPPARPNADQFELVYDGEVVIYRNNNAFPRAFIVHEAEVVSDAEEAIERMKDRGFDPAQVAVIEGSPSPAQLAALTEGKSTGGARAEITKYQDERVELSVETERPGLLVLSDTYYPGWKAYVDGKQVPVYPTDVALRSIFVPAGEHDVEFVYSPGSFNLGLTITIASFAVLVLYVAWGPVRSALGVWTGRARQDR